MENMEIKLYSFSEALEKLKNKEITVLIRAKDMEADYQNRCILLYHSKRYITLHPSFTSGKPDILWQVVKNGNGATGSYAYIESKDILADDYIDTSTWTLCETSKDYQNAKNNINKQLEQE